MTSIFQQAMQTAFWHTANRVCGEGFLREFHVDVMGPAKDITLLMPQFTSEEQLLTVVMYRRTGREEELTGKPIVLNAKKEDKFVYLDVPEGCWRVFYVSASFTRANSQTDYIDMLSQESVHKLIEAVYEPHYAYYAPLYHSIYFMPSA